MLTTTAAISQTDHAQVCLWLRVLAVSGVEVPWELVQHLSAHESIETLSLSTLRDLIAVMEANESHTGPEDYAAMSCHLLSKLSAIFMNTPGAFEPVQVETDTLHHGLLLVLKAYGVPDEDTQATSLSNANNEHMDPVRAAEYVRRIDCS